MNFGTEEVLMAFALTFFAGLSTGIGSAIAFFAKRTNKAFLAASLGFSAGVMIYVSFVELFMASRQSLSALYGDTEGYYFATLSFFAGIFLIALIDKLVPEKENPHEIKNVGDVSPEMLSGYKNNRLLRTGLITALVLGIHNFPEGMVTFLSGLQDMCIAVPVAVAIAIHNIPEGISVSMPVYYATGNRKKAFWLSFLSGLAEPVGAVCGYFLLLPFLSEALMGFVFGMISGIMIFISIDELLPAAEEYGKHHIAIYGLIGGMGIMAVSLLIFS